MIYSGATYCRLSSAPGLIEQIFVAVFILDDQPIIDARVPASARLMADVQ